MTFIVLTDESDGQPILINLVNIVSVRTSRYDSAHTVIETNSSSDDPFIRVNESYEHVYRVLDNGGVNLV